MSIIFRGAYREFVRGIAGPFIRVWISIRFYRAEHTHRVEIIRPVWSLVIARRPRRAWGFWTKERAENGVLVDKWTPADVFLNDPTVYDWPEDRL